MAIIFYFSHLKQAISPYPFLPIFATGGHDLHLRVYTSPFRAPSPPLPLLAERHDGHLIGQSPKKSAGLLLTPVSRSTQSALERLVHARGDGGKIGGVAEFGAT